MSSTCGDLQAAKIGEAIAEGGGRGAERDRAVRLGELLAPTYGGSGDVPSLGLECGTVLSRGRGTGDGTVKQDQPVRLRRVAVEQRPHPVHAFEFHPGRRHRVDHMCVK